MTAGEAVVVVTSDDGTMRVYGPVGRREAHAAVDELQRRVDELDPRAELGIMAAVWVVSEWQGVDAAFDAAVSS